jgi:hypothetical protein
MYKRFIIKHQLMETLKFQKAFVGLKFFSRFSREIVYYIIEIIR